MARDLAIVSTPRALYFGVRCRCGAYMVLDEVRGDPAQARCDRLDQAAWIICDGCGEERQYQRADLIQFAWPPASGEMFY
ncbi:MAG TPA: hypothetical protein VN515_09530 [Terriglobales bacterium]|nr:hypothetical protein [Terriglobales bacterium]